MRLITTFTTAMIIIVCINNSRAQTPLVVDDDFLFGADQSPQNGENYSNKILFFDYGKAALRMGNPLGSNWSPDSIGTYSFSSGVGSKAIGENSTAIGRNTEASGNFSTAMGFITQANGDNSFAMGSNNKANGDNSFAIGRLTEANGENSNAMGGSTEANGQFSTAIGVSTVANGYASTVLGMYNNTIVDPQESIIDQTDESPLFIIGNGRNSSVPSNAMEVLKSGKASFYTNNLTLKNEKDAHTRLIIDGHGSDKRNSIEFRHDDDYRGAIGWDEDNDRIFIFQGGNVLFAKDGNLEVVGNLSKGGGSFKIDHPLDPENKYLYHSFVESPDMMNVYNGNVRLDTTGSAIIELPDWFDSLNSQFRYQLTCIGGYGQVYVAEEILNNQFKIGGGHPGLKVSWQVTGIRKDPYAQMNRVQVEEDKPKQLKGRYLHPEAYGPSLDNER